MVAIPQKNGESHLIRSSSCKFSTEKLMETKSLQSPSSSVSTRDYDCDLTGVRFAWSVIVLISIHYRFTDAKFEQNNCKVWQLRSWRLSDTNKPLQCTIWPHETTGRTGKSFNGDKGRVQLRQSLFSNASVAWFTELLNRQKWVSAL